MEEFIEKYNVKTYFLEYNSITIKIKRFLEWKDYPEYREPYHRKSFLNILLNLSVKGSSRLHTRMKNSNSHILDNIVSSWEEKTNIEMEYISLGRSFIKHHLRYKDTFLKYIQFGTLHNRFYTNAKLYKMGIKPSNLCGFCRTEIDSMQHMFLDCEISKAQRAEVKSWIIEPGMTDYNLSNMKIIVGDLENALAVNTIILLTKKVIYSGMKKEQKQHICNIKNEVKKFYYQEKYSQYIKDRGKIVDQQYTLLKQLYENNN